MPSFFKTQWWRLLLSLACFIMFIVQACKPTNWTTPEGIQDSVCICIGMIMWIVSCATWSIMAFIDWHDKCVEAIEKRLNTLEQRAITDIDEVGPNHFEVKRKLGPDKEVRPQPPKSGSRIEKPKNTVTVTVTKDGKMTETTYSIEDFDLNKIVRKALD